MEPILDQITQVVGPYLPRLAAALAILIGGWLIALVLGAIVRRALRRTTLDNRLAAWFAGEDAAKGTDVETWAGNGVYYLVMLFVLVAVFQTLGLTILTEPLNGLLSQIFQFAPRLFGAGILLLIAWLLASGLRVVLSRVLTAAKLEERLGTEAGLEEGQRIPLGKTIAEAVYWFVFLLFLPAILDALGLQGLLAPVQGMFTKIAAFLPNLFTAGVTLVVGWFLARIVQRIVTSLLAAAGLDALSERVGLAGVLGKQRLSGVLGLVVYVFVFIPILITALSALQLSAITQPVSNMLNMIMESIPAVFAAILVLTIAYAVGRVVSVLVTNLLAGMGFNALLARLGLGKESTAEGTRSPSVIVGSLVSIAILLFAITEAANLLGFAALSDLIAQFLVFAGHVIFGLVLFGIGLYLAQIASNTVLASGTAQAGLLAMVARLSILTLVGAMALRQMGLANEIITLAFGLILGAVAIAAAIAFGIGGREVAGRKIEEWVESAKASQSES